MRLRLEIRPSAIRLPPGCRSLNKTPPSRFLTVPERTAPPSSTRLHNALRDSAFERFPVHYCRCCLPPCCKEYPKNAYPTGTVRQKRRHVEYVTILGIHATLTGFQKLDSSCWTQFKRRRTRRRTPRPGNLAGNLEKWSPRRAESRFLPPSTTERLQRQGGGLRLGLSARIRMQQ